jgi:hypothetical protein
VRSDAETPPKRQSPARETPTDHYEFDPTSASRMNTVEVCFGIITRQAIRRGTFASVPVHVAAIRPFIDAYNERCEPFAWTMTADQILTEANLPSRERL